MLDNVKTTAQTLLAGGRRHLCQYVDNTATPRVSPQLGYAPPTSDTKLLN